MSDLSIYLFLFSSIILIIVLTYWSVTDFRIPVVIFLHMPVLTALSGTNDFHWINEDVESNARGNSGNRYYQTLS